MSFKEIYTRIIPASTIASVLGIGNLPDWQRHWASFSSLCFCLAVLCFGFDLKGATLDSSLPAEQVLSFGVNFVTISVAGYIIAFFAIKLYLIRNNDHQDRVVADVFIGFIFFVGLAFPALDELRNFCADFIHSICSKYIMCKDWITVSLISFFVCFIPFGVYRFLDFIKIWPSNVLVHSYEESALIKILDTLFVGFYSALFMYCFSIIVLNLEPIVASDYLKAFLPLTFVELQLLYNNILIFFLGLDLTSVVNNVGLLSVFEKLGLIFTGGKA